MNLCALRGIRIRAAAFAVFLLVLPTRAPSFQIFRRQNLKAPSFQIFRAEGAPRGRLHSNVPVYNLHMLMPICGYDTHLELEAGVGVYGEEWGRERRRRSDFHVISVRPLESKMPSAIQRPEQ